MTGSVRDEFPRLLVDTLGPNGHVGITCIVDTGFDGELALPSTILLRIDATPTDERFVYMADHTKRFVKHYDAIVIWQGEERTVEVMELDGRPLVGNGLLRGNLLQIEMEEGGTVLIEPL